MNLAATAHDEPACGACHACSRFHVRASGPRAKTTASAIGARTVAARLVTGLMTAWAMPLTRASTNLAPSTRQSYLLTPPKQYHPRREICAAVTRDPHKPKRL